MSTAEQIVPGSWVWFDRHDRWWFVTGARHGDGFVQFDAVRWPLHRVGLGGFAEHSERCRIVTVTPGAVAA